MIQFTWPNGQKTDVDPAEVVCIQEVAHGLGEPGSKTRIDWVETYYVVEEPADVAAAIGDELKSLVQLKLPGGSSVWLNAKVIKGPVYVTKKLRTDGIASSVRLGSQTIYLGSSPQEVFDAILSVGGHPLTLRDDRPEDGTEIQAFAIAANLDPIANLMNAVTPKEPEASANLPVQKLSDDEVKKSAGTRGTFEDIEKTDLSRDEFVALKALKKYDFNASSYNLYDTIDNFGGGTLVLAEVFSGTGAQQSGPYEYQILVKNGRGVVYSDFSQTVRQGTERTSLFARLVYADTVIAGLTFVLTFAFLIFSAIGNAPEALGVALTTVIGFWFGRNTASSLSPNAGTR
ncbi:hypothetical protein [Rhizobium leguminosarum]|uniref:hypothetical protein n=1 Tax=Rhizobium leguminosarum TaxID=384 RepID=UPI001442288B|nr:hypothetical protein [Rhizobium leguminosarum]NKK81729.1 hypothetical protein [Rhizobium leguminosarum bv. viciae]